MKATPTDSAILVVNPGSVALQAYNDDAPYFHVIENGSPHTRYSVLAEQDGGIHVEQIVVPYNYQAASETAIQNGRNDWGLWLKTGNGVVTHVIPSHNEFRRIIGAEARCGADRHRSPARSPTEKSLRHLFALCGCLSASVTENGPV